MDRLEHGTVMCAVTAIEGRKALIPDRASIRDNCYWRGGLDPIGVGSAPTFPGTVLPLP